jgi:4-hydroxybenzoate polyprenyltransferase
MANRWWVYQRERFPLLVHGPLIAAMSVAAVSVSRFLRGGTGLPAVGQFLVAFLTTLVLFLQLRIADEFKDRDADARYRAYRAVPRGLVRLRELGAVAAAGAILQFGLAVWLHPSLVLLLAAVWVYQGLMWKEFFAQRYLTAHPIAYLGSHMPILPLVTLYATACEWYPAGVPLPRGLAWLFAAGFFNGLVIEIGRKIRAPEAEERGVETYSALWGGRTATLAWWSAMLLAAAASLLVAKAIGLSAVLAVAFGSVLVVAALTAWRFLDQPTAKRAALFEPLSGLWMLVAYLGLGVGPWLWRA